MDYVTDQPHIGTSYNKMSAEMKRACFANGYRNYRQNKPYHVLIDNISNPSSSSEEIISSDEEGLFNSSFSSNQHVKKCVEKCKCKHACKDDYCDVYERQFEQNVELEFDDNLDAYFGVDDGGELSFYQATWNVSSEKETEQTKKSNAKFYLYQDSTDSSNNNGSYGVKQEWRPEGTKQICQEDHNNSERLRTWQNCLLRTSDSIGRFQVPSATSDSPQSSISCEDTSATCGITFSICDISGSHNNV